MKIRTMGLLFATLLLAGCWQKSLNPFYTAQDVIAEPKLAGVWKESRNANESGDAVTWEFTRGDEKRYDLVIWNKEERQEYDAHVFKLAGERFLDIGSKARTISTVPAHHLFKLLEAGPDLKVAGLNTDWMQKWLRENPESLAHVAILDPEHRNDRDRDELVLTADTKALQSFVRNHLDEKDFFADATVLKRHSHAGIASENK